MKLSIRSTLLILLFLVLLLAIVLNSVLGHLLVRHEVNEVFDAELAVSAKLIKGILSEGNLEDDLPRISAAMNESFGRVQPDQPELEAYERTRLIQIWRKDGNGLLFRSPGAPDHALAPLRAGFYHHQSSSNEWMVYVTDLPTHDAWLMVGEYPHARHDIIRELGGIFGVSGVVALILCTLIALAAIEYGLSPLRRLGSRLRRRSADNLKPVRLHRTPKELQPVVDGLNDMFSRLSSGIERERRFIDDAAHELRTPLAVLKLQSQHLQSLSPQQQRDALSELERGTDRASQLVEQLLILARMDNTDRIPVAPADVTEAVRRTLASLQWQADEHQVELTLDADDTLPAVAVDPALIAMALRNLVDNAIRYGGDRQRVETRLTVEKDELCLSVRDQGPGVAEDDLPRLSERFFRAQGSPSADSRQGGSGLGLSIVSRIVDTCAGRLQLRNHPQGGLEVTLRIPLQGLSSAGPGEG
ncbi:MAG: hypothetical protein CMI02_05390 [Oceanospirillaceae bacterium]|nr:hypothetical protein [Oceanospirillaceae bacterium]